MNPRQMFELLGFNDAYVSMRMQRALSKGGVLGVNRELLLFKEEAKKRYRKKAKELHPDMAGDHEMMVALNQADEFLQKLKVQITKPRQMFEVYTQVYHGYGWNATSTTSGSASSVNRATANDWVSYGRA